MQSSICIVQQGYTGASLENMILLGISHMIVVEFMWRIRSLNSFVCEFLFFGWF